jgi:hypothetical protein
MIVAVSAAPLRHKPAMITAPVLLVAGYAVQMFAALRVYALI